MSDKMALINKLKEEGYSIEHCEQGKFKVTDTKVKGWTVYISDSYIVNELKLILTTKDEMQNKVYDEGHWKEAMNDIFFMYHCMHD